MRRCDPHRSGTAASLAVALALAGVRVAAAGGLPTTSTTTTSTTISTTTRTNATSTTTTLPPALRCENGVETALATLGAKLTACSVTAARRALRGKTSHEAACRAKARARYERLAVRFRRCPGCLEPTRSAIADDVLTLFDAARAAAFCDSPVPADRAALRCGTRALRIGTRYLGKLIGCRVEAARQTFRGETPDEAACERAARPGSSQLKGLRSCVCVKSNALLDAVFVASGGVHERVYCPCVYGKPKACDDGEACTTDTCDAASGCTHAPAADMTPCENDGSACTLDVCRAGACAHDVRADGTVCDDSDKCNVGTCRTGACVAAPTVCDDLNPCTDDACNPATGCVFTNNTAPCGDGKFCTVNDHCANGTCMPGPPRNCDDGDPTTCDECDEDANACFHAPCS